MSFLSILTDASSNGYNLDPVAWTSLAFNAVAVAVLIAALFPPFLDTKRSKKTFGISAGFFKCYVKANSLMIINSLATAVGELIFLSGPIGQWNNSASIARLILFGGVFMCINCMSIYMNSYILRTKLANAKAAEEMGISEQEYYEKYLAKNAQQ